MVTAVNNLKGTNPTITEDKLVECYYHLICHASEISKANDWVRLDFFGREIVLFNDGGEIVAFDNLCPHRGVRIFQGITGNSLFVCPYHSLSYSRGKTYIRGKSGFSGELALHKIRFERCGDFLFAGFDPQESLRSQLGDFYGAIEDMSLSISER